MLVLENEELLIYYFSKQHRRNWCTEACDVSRYQYCSAVLRFIKYASFFIIEESMVTYPF